MNSTPQYREHRSGNRYRVDIPYKARRKRLVFLPFETYQREIQHLPDSYGVWRTWRLYNQKEILQILTELDPNHSVTMRTLKVSMIEKWYELEDPKLHKTFKEKVTQYTYNKIMQVTNDPMKALIG